MRSAKSDQAALGQRGCGSYEKICSVNVIVSVVPDFDAGVSPANLTVREDVHFTGLACVHLVEVTAIVGLRVAVLFPLTPLTEEALKISLDN